MHTTISVITPIIVLTGICVSAYFIIKQMRFNYLLSLRNKGLAYTLYSSDPLIKARLKTEAVFGNLFNVKEAIPMTDIDDAISNDHEVLTSIMTLLAHWENMGLAIFSGVADEDVCFEMVAGTMIQHVKVFRNFIDRRRESNNRAYYYLLKLRRNWEERLTTFTRSEFPPILPIGRQISWIFRSPAVFRSASSG